jgi:oligopeptide/dipeptide ABC transporter ATP-binding protein
VDLDVGRGEAVGIVGESGSGKSMTLRCINRLTPPGAQIRGEVRVADRDVLSLSGSALRMHRRQVGMVFQDPRSAINPMHSVESFLLESARNQREDVPAARHAAIDLLVRMGIPDPQRRMRQYPFELSGGLLQRVMIASALLSGPQVLLADEPTTALDVTTQSDVLAITDQLRRESGVALLFVTHDLDLAMAICDRVAVLYAGRIMEIGAASTIGGGSLHPYTRGLLASRPPLAERLAEIPVIPGLPISAAQAGDGCAFASRCQVAMPICASQPPEAVPHPGGTVFCHRAVEIARGDLDDQLPVRQPIPRRGDS